MRNAKKALMRALVLAPGVLLFSAAGSCVAPSNDSMTETETGTGTAPAGFDHWLHGQCPDGNTMRIVTENDAHDIPCAAVREELLVNPSSRETLVRAYMEQREEPISEATSGERIGEAKQPGVLSSLLCGLIVNALLGYQCHRVNAHWSDCWAAGVPPSILCAFIPIP